MKKILKWAFAWIIICNIGLMGLNILLLFSRPAHAAPALQTEIQTALESRIALLEKQYQLLDERLQMIEILLGIVALEEPYIEISSESAVPAVNSRSQFVSDVSAPAPTAAPAEQQYLQPFTAYRTNARSGPGTNYPIIKNLAEGENLEIIGYNNDSGQIWYKMASGPWLADFLVRNAPGAIPYVAAPDLDEARNLNNINSNPNNLNPSEQPVDAKSDPPTLPSPSQPDTSSSDSSSAPLQPASRLPTADSAASGTAGQMPQDIQASSATSFATSNGAVAEPAPGENSVVNMGTGGETGESMVATAQVTAQFDTGQSNAGQSNTAEPNTVTDAPQAIDEIPNAEPAPAPLSTLPISPSQPALNCNGGCIEYPAWCDPPIKGIVTYDTNELIYYLPSHPNYGDYPIETVYGERWFCTAEEAISAGWRSP